MEIVTGSLALMVLGGIRNIPVSLSHNAVAIEAGPTVVGASHAIFRLRLSAASFRLSATARISIAPMLLPTAISRVPPRVPATSPEPVSPRTSAASTPPSV